jgi:hypothetical protein
MTEYNPRYAQRLTTKKERAEWMLAKAQAIAKVRKPGPKSTFHFTDYMKRGDDAGIIPHASASTDPC